MNSVIIIPARFASSRFPGKPLTMFRGSDGVSRSLIEHTWRAGLAVRGIEAVYVATDDRRIAEVCESFGAEVVMTSTSCTNGTERCAHALKSLGIAPDVVLNLQGDAPLTPPWFLEVLISEFQRNPQIDAATPVVKCDEITKGRLLKDRREGRVGGTTAVFDRHRNALYFSKEVLPYGKSSVFHHVGAYAYRPKTLSEYPTWAEGRLERSEGLEQLRFLENGKRMVCVEVDAKGRESWEVNNPEDVPLIERILGVGDV